ncbi:hypothetical protein [Methylobacter sp. BlB1]|nr:hypothetical protein [Methylobacter sp. BlB1]
MSGKRQGNSLGGREIRPLHYRAFNCRPKTQVLEGAIQAIE